jgi:hypothetical protein
MPQERQLLEIALLRDLIKFEEQDQVLDVASLVDRYPDQPVEEALRRLESYGLYSDGTDGGLPPLVFPAGRQFIEREAEVERELLVFLPHYISDLNTREALICGGQILIDEFAAAIAADGGVDYAQQLVPLSYEPGIDKRMALRLYAAASALLARLSTEEPAGCLAEEVIALSLISEAHAWLEMQGDLGELDEDEVVLGRAATEDLFELFQDDDVRFLFGSEQGLDAEGRKELDLGAVPAVIEQDGGAAVASAKKAINEWFEPLWGGPGTGHLRALG